MRRLVSSLQCGQSRVYAESATAEEPKVAGLVFLLVFFLMML
jgi:hypothetical protein